MKNGQLMADIQRRIELARDAMRRLSTLWKATKIREALIGDCIAVLGTYSSEI